SDSDAKEYLTLEGESASLVSPMAIQSSSSASNGKFVVSPTHYKGEVSFTFNAPSAGTYVIWCRLLVPDSNHDSFYVTMDGAGEDIYDPCQDQWSSNWQWSALTGRATSPQARKFTLSAGQHTLTLKVRECNTGIDKIIVTNDLNYNPGS